MSPEILLTIALFEVEYAAFNAKRSLSTTTSRLASVQQTPDGVLIRCPEASKTPYLNRLVTTQQPTNIPEGVLQVDRISQSSDRASLHILGRKPQLAMTDSLACVTQYDASRSLDFLRIIESLSEKALSDEILAAKSPYYCSDEFRCFVAEKNGKVLGVATTYVRDGLGWLANAYTFPAARRQGVHQALLSARLADARDLGLRDVFTDVVPDSASERNLLRAGFAHVTYYC